MWYVVCGMYVVCGLWSVVCGMWCIIVVKDSCDCVVAVCIEHECMYVYI